MAKKPTEIRVLVKEVGKEPEISTIPNTLEAMQAVVGGYIEHVRLGRFDLYCNEDGRLQNLPMNCRLAIPGHPLHGCTLRGPIFIMKGVAKGLTDAEVEAAGLTDAEVEAAKKLLDYASFMI